MSQPSKSGDLDPCRSSVDPVPWLTRSLAQALNRIRKAVEHRRQERVQKRRLQPVTNPEAAAATRRAKNRRRAEGAAGWMWKRPKTIWWVLTQVEKQQHKNVNPSRL